MMPSRPHCACSGLLPLDCATLHISPLPARWRFPSSPSLPRFVTSDGVTIRGSFAPSSKPSCGNSNTSTHKRTRHSPAVILVHGFSMCRGKYEVTMLAHFLWNKGFSVLTLDMRNHGKSDTVKQQGSGKKGVATYVVVGEGHRERGV